MPAALAGRYFEDFFYFFRAEGKSGKSGPDRGRWGIGKYVFPKASKVNTFFAMTAREPGSPDTPGPLLMGQAVMKNQKIGDVSPTDGELYLPTRASRSPPVVWTLSRTSDRRGGVTRHTEPAVLASNGRLHEELLRVVAGLPHTGRPKALDRQAGR